MLHTVLAWAPWSWLLCFSQLRQMAHHYLFYLSCYLQGFVKKHTKFPAWLVYHVFSTPFPLPDTFQSREMRSNVTIPLLSSYSSLLSLPLSISFNFSIILNFLIVALPFMSKTIMKKQGDRIQSHMKSHCSSVSKTPVDHTHRFSTTCKLPLDTRIPYWDSNKCCNQNCVYYFKALSSSMLLVMS